MSRRRKAREYALQLLFGLDITKDYSGWGSFVHFWADKDDPDDLVEFCRSLVTGTGENVEAIDEALRGAAENWSLERMNAVDRNILRLAAYEIMFRPDIPASVSINEALEIAKKFSTPDSASFINGILDRIAKGQTEATRENLTPAPLLKERG
jgi:N utilization substance protein B